MRILRAKFMRPMSIRGLGSVTEVTEDGMRVEAGCLVIPGRKLAYPLHLLATLEVAGEDVSPAELPPKTASGRNLAKK